MPTPIWRDTSPVGPLLRPSEAARYLGMQRRTYYEKAAKGLLPRPQSMDGDGRATFVPLRWLNAVIEDRFAREGEK